MNRSKPPQGPKPFLKRQLWGVGRTAVWGTLLVVTATLFSYLGPLWWFFDLFCHFRLQYALVLLASLLWFGIRRTPRGFFPLAMAAWLANALPVARLYLPPPEPSGPTSEEADLRFMLINVNAANTAYAQVAEAIRAADPDIVLLEEVTPEWVRGISTRLEGYRFSHFQPRIDCFGIGLLSRIARTHCDTAYIGGAGVPSLVAQVPVKSGSLTVIGTHPLPPTGGRYARARNEQLARLPDALAGQPRPLVLIGDLNSTPWSRHFSQLLKRTGLRNSQQGFGLQRSWPAGRMLMGIPIDHLLHSPEIRVVDRRLGPAVGSDHLPIIVDLALPRIEAADVGPEGVPRGGTPEPLFTTPVPALGTS